MTSAQLVDRDWFSAIAPGECWEVSATPSTPTLPMTMLMRIRPPLRKPKDKMKSRLPELIQLLPEC